MWAVQLWRAAAIVSRPSVFGWWTLQVIYSDWFLAGFLMKKHHNASHLILILLHLQSVAVWVAAYIIKSLLSNAGFKSSKQTGQIRAIHAKTCELKGIFVRFFWVTAQTDDHSGGRVAYFVKLESKRHSGAWNVVVTHTRHVARRDSEAACLPRMCLCREDGRWERVGRARGREGGWGGKDA